jgi:phosphatidylinositol glycan class B
MKFQELIFIFALIWYTGTAYFSIGVFHPDEHYQIVEFAGIIDNPGISKDLAWEFDAQIRSALQPVLCNLIFKVCNLISISDPYDKAFVLRLITGWLAVLIIHLFTNSVKGVIDFRFRNLFLILSYFIWFLPFINVRFSSETWSGLSFLLSLSLIVRSNKKTYTYLIAGLILGFSFLFRNQIAFAILGLVLWLIFIKKESFYHIILISASGLMAIIIGFLIDSWFYGNWTLTIWNNLKVNLIDGKSSEFGISPWYYYFFYTFRFSFFPFGIIIILSFLYLVYKRINSIFVWIILSFLIVHSLIPHKELRFLFPLVNLVPIMIILAFQDFPKVSWMNTQNKFIKGLMIFFISANLIGAIVASIKPIGVPIIRIEKAIHEMAIEKPLNVFYFDERPFSYWGITSNFYAQNNVKINKLDFQNQALTSHAETGMQNLLFVSLKDARNLEIQKFIRRMNMKENTRSIHELLIPFLMIYGYNTETILILYSNE